MKYETILVEKIRCGVSIKFNRIDNRNSINSLLLKELENYLDIIEDNNEIKFIMFENSDNYFCTGMDFAEVLEGNEVKEYLNMYMNILDRLSNIGKVIISNINGKVSAGGIGFVAVSDIVISSMKSEFNFVEILWGLIPSMVAPYLIRRIGYQKSLKMALTGEVLSAEMAKDIGLVDIISENTKINLNNYWSKISRYNAATIKQTKEYFSSIYSIDKNVKEKAVEKTFELVSDSKIKNNINNFIKYGKFPWEN